MALLGIRSGPVSGSSLGGFSIGKASIANRTDVYALFSFFIEIKIFFIARIPDGEPFQSWAIIVG